MKLFSHRHGHKAYRTQVQLDGMDEALHNRLWNVMWEVFLKEHGGYMGGVDPLTAAFLTAVWDDHFKQPADTIPWSFADICKALRDCFFACEWYEVYDFCEFCATKYPREYATERFMARCNDVLKEELSGYRFVGACITPITSDDEIAEVEEALSKSGQFAGTKAHLKCAVELLSDRKNPDYRNSIKESISAVEGACSALAQDPKAKLGHALKQLKDHGVDFHPALEQAFSKLYGYTSDADGIRHALTEAGVRLDQEDARFMLIACSAFINYLRQKATKAGLKA